MTFRVRKMVVIGLGGTGRDAVLNIKRKYMEVYGTDNLQTTKFLVFDTADTEPKSLPDGTQVRLQAGEFFKMGSNNPAAVARVNPEVRPWFPEDGVPMAAINAGAGQVRALGRLALFANGREVYARVKNALDEVKALRPQQDLGQFELVDETSLLVAVVGSLSGGTGSGTFLDMAYLCRQHLNNRDTLAAYLLLPDVFVGKPATHNVQPNAYGAVKELDHLMGLGEAGRFNYMLGGEQVRVNTTPFDMVYLLNNQNRRGQVFPEVEELTELLGTGIFIASGAAGKNAGDVWDNLRNQIPARGTFDGKRAHYVSFGVSELVLDGERFAEQEAHRIAIKTVESTFLGLSSSSISEDVDAFVTTNGLCEHDADQVIDALLTPGRYRQFHLPEEVTKKNIEEILDRRDGHLQLVEAEAKQTIGDNLKRLQAEKVEAIRERIRAALAQPNGLNYALGFANTLTGRFEAYRQEMQQERDAFQERRKGMGGRYKAQREEAVMAKQRFLGGAKLIEETAKNFEATLNADAGAMVEAMRRNEAGVLYTALIADVKRTAEELGDLQRRLEALGRTLNHDLERLRSQQQSMRPFTIELALPDSFATAQASPEDFLVWLREQGLSVLDLARLDSADLAARLLEFARTRASVGRIRELRIEDVLRTLPREELAKRVKELDSVASPMWQYDEAHVAGSQGTELLYLFGVANADETIFTSDLTQQMLSSNQPPKMTTTADPRRVFCYKVEAAVPAFTVTGMEHYKLRYENGNAAFSYHVHREWERQAADLWPNADAGSRRVWSLGNAEPFGLITKRGAYYYAKSKSQGRAVDGHEVKLDQGRERALKAFVGNTKLVAEVNDEIERITRTRGAEATAEALRGYREKLAQDGGGREADVRQLLEEEIQDVDAYVSEITSRI